MKWQNAVENRLVQFGAIRSLQCVKNTVSMKLSKAKHNKTKYACIGFQQHLEIKQQFSVLGAGLILPFCTLIWNLYSLHNQLEYNRLYLRTEKQESVVSSLLMR